MGDGGNVDFVSRERDRRGRQRRTRNERGPGGVERRSGRDRRTDRRRLKDWAAQQR